MVTPATDALEALKIDRRGEDGPGRRRWPLVAIGLGLLVVIPLGAFWLIRGQAAEVSTIEARAAEGGAAGPRVVLNASGYVTARRQATVSSRISGRVDAVLFEEGTPVEEGQVLARLDAEAVRVQLNYAEAQVRAARGRLVETEALLREARLRLDRTKTLRAEAVASEADLDSARAVSEALEARLETGRDEVAVAERQVGIHRQTLDDTVIRAPFSGVAVTKNAQPGEMISPMSAGGSFTRTGICTIVDMRSLETEVDVSETYINRVRPGQRVRITLDAYPSDPFDGRVITTIPTADRQKATVKVRIGFDALDPRILPDMGAKVAFQEDPPANGTISAPRLFVPRAAVRQDGGKDVVYLVKEGRLERRAVKLAAGTGDEAEVEAGLASGDAIVVEGPADLQDGQRVSVKARKALDTSS